MTRQQLITGLSLAATRKKLSNLSSRVARERKAIDSNADTIKAAVSLLRSVAKEIKASSEFRVQAYGAVCANAFCADSPVEVTVSTSIRFCCNTQAESAFKNVFEFAKLKGLEGEIKRDRGPSYSSANLVRQMDNVTVNLFLELKTRETENTKNFETL